MIDILIAYAFLAVGIVANKYILASMSAEFFVALRMLISGSILGVYNWHQADRLSFSHIKKNWFNLLAIAACTTFIPALLKAWSLKHMPATKQSLLGSIDPFVTALMVYILFSEKISPSKMAGMLIGFLGTVVVILSRSSQEIGYEWLWRISYPELAIIAAVIMSRYGWIVVQKLLRDNHYTSIQINTLVQLIAGTLSLCVAFYTGQLHFYQVQNCSMFIAAFLITVVGGNIIGYTLYSEALKRHSATLVSLAGFSIPLLVAVLAMFFLGETITWGLALGGLLIFIGLMVFYLGEKSLSSIEKLLNS